VTGGCTGGLSLRPPPQPITTTENMRVTFLFSSGQFQLSLAPKGAGHNIPEVAGDWLCATVAKFCDRHRHSSATAAMARGGVGVGAGGGGGGGGDTVDLYAPAVRPPTVHAAKRASHQQQQRGPRPPGFHDTK
jgi:hypothetical protein